MRSLVSRFRCAALWAAAGLAFQALALVLQVPMVSARDLPPMAAADHCEAGGHHGGAPVRAADLCQICIGMQAAGHAVTPESPALPRQPAPSSPVLVVSGTDAPALDVATPQNPRAPPLPI